MDDLRERLDRRVRGIRTSPNALDHVRRRAAHRQALRRITTIVVAAALFAGSATGLLVAFWPVRTPRPAQTPTRSPSLVFPEHVTGLVVADGAVWALGAEGGDRSNAFVLRVDPATGRLEAKIPVSGASLITAGGGSVWVSSYPDGVVTRIDPSTDQILATQRFGHLTLAPWMAYEDGALWVLVNGTLVRVDPATDTSTEVAPVALPDSMAAGFGSLWVRSGERRVVERIDPRTGSLQASIALPGGFEGIVRAAAGSIWVTAHPSETALSDLLLRIDPSSNEIAATIELAGAGPYDLASGGGLVWVADTAGRLWKIDPASDAVAARIDVPEVPNGVTVIGSTVWITNGTDRIIRLPTCTPECR